jgi:iron complex outermembrane receptor protein
VGWEDGKCGVSQKTCQTQTFRNHAFGNKSDDGLLRTPQRAILTPTCHLFIIRDKWQRMKKIFLIVAILWFAALNAQQSTISDTVVLHQFMVIDVRSAEQNPALLRTNIETNEPGNKVFSLGTLLSRLTPAFIKQYGPGGLSSPSLRGTGAAHTALIWNGINLQSSMNGQQDLSLIPALMFDNFLVQEGSANAAWGSGAIGGSIFLENKMPSKPLIRFGSSIGSYGLSQQFGDFTYGSERIRLRTKVFSSRAINNFKYKDVSLPDQPIHHQQNASSETYGIMQDVSLKSGKRSTFDASLWYQQALRHIPPILTVPYSVAHQFDKSIRANARYTYEKGKMRLKVNLALLDEFIHFKDSMLLQDAENRSRSYINEVSISNDLHRNHHVEFGVIYTLTEALADGYGLHKRHQNRPALFASIRSHWFKRKTVTLLSLRQEFLNGKSIQPQPSLSASHELFPILKLRTQLAGTFRIPTLNDLYWAPGGNPALEPEQGISAEGGFDLNLDFFKKRLVLFLQPGIFYNRVNNWIQWSPSANYWSPSNLQSVESRGMELKAHVEMKFNDSQSLSLFMHAQHVNSRIDKNDHSHDLEGKQLIYIPAQTSSSGLSFNLRRFCISVLHNYVSERFVTTDNSEFLPSYHLFHLNASYSIEFGSMSCNLFSQLNNIGNETYHVVLRRPMPMRTWQAGIHFEFN